MKMLMFAMLMLFSAPVYAEDTGGSVDVSVKASEAAVAPTPTTPATRIATQVIEVVAYGVGVVLMGLLGMLIKAVEKKFKVDVPDEYEVYMNKLLDKGIDYAEEKARAKITPIAEKVSLGKLDTAADFVLHVAERKQVKQMSKDKLKMLIESRLQAKRKEAPASVAGPKT